MANADPVNDAAVSIFFDQAEELRFQLFFSFDYAGNGPWPISNVTLLPFLIDTYKYGKATIDKEGLTVWHRPQPASAYGSGGTSGNTASQLQIVFHPTEIAQDYIFFSALFSAPATIAVSVPASQLDLATRRRCRHLP